MSNKAIRRMQHNRERLRQRASEAAAAHTTALWHSILANPVHKRLHIAWLVITRGQWSGRIAAAICAVSLAVILFCLGALWAMGDIAASAIGPAASDRGGETVAAGCGRMLEGSGESATPRPPEASSRRAVQ